MSPAEMYAYRASPAVLAAYEQHIEARTAFYDEIITPFTQAHPDNEPMWRGTNYRRTCVGFADGAAEVPAGLSRNRQRHFLIPRKNAAGESWRAMMEALNTFPSLGKVLATFGIEDEILDVDRSRMVSPGMRLLDGRLYFTCAVPMSSAALTPIKLSEYFAEVERQEAADARARATQGKASDA